jgi:hypothetical protein
MVQPENLIHLRRTWRYNGEGDAIHFVIVAGTQTRHIKLKREDNPALHKLIAENATAIPTGPGVPVDPDDG